MVKLFSLTYINTGYNMKICNCRFKHE